MIGEKFTGTASNHADAIALVFADRRISYRELEARACRVAGALAGLGIGRGLSALGVSFEVDQGLHL
jgi:non-ribosomal peptide synthetase component E (peptide arylation enzyme)